MSYIWGLFASEFKCFRVKFYLVLQSILYLQFPLCYDEYSSRNLAAFMKVVNRNNVSTELIFPSEILHKCIIISRDEDESDLCIPWDIRIEKD